MIVMRFLVPLGTQAHGAQWLFFSHTHAYRKHGQILLEFSLTSCVFIFRDKTFHSMESMYFIMPTPEGPEINFAHFVRCPISPLRGLNSLHQHK